MMSVDKGIIDAIVRRTGKKTSILNIGAALPKARTSEDLKSGAKVASIDLAKHTVVIVSSEKHLNACVKSDDLPSAC